MKKQKIYNICVWWILIDQLIKITIAMKMKLYQKLIIIPGFFKINYLKNKGAAFSNFEGKKILLVAVAILVFALLNIYISKNKINRKLEIMSLGMIMGGLVGNLIDRLLYGSVIDYLAFTFFDYSFAVFNFADIGIVLGAIILVIDIVRSEIYERRSGSRKSKNR